jgi:hypothetical protein
MKRLAHAFGVAAACGILVAAAVLAADSRLTDIALFARIAR